jgi:hypothetical protein
VKYHCKAAVDDLVAAAVAVADYGEAGVIAATADYIIVAASVLLFPLVSGLMVKRITICMVPLSVFLINLRLDRGAYILPALWGMMGVVM